MTLEYTRDELLDKLLNAFQSSYDIEQNSSLTAPLSAVCHYYERSAKYVLSKKAELWNASSAEHVYFFSVPELTESLYKACEKQAYEQGMALIKPGPGHMCSNITAIFLCDSYTQDAQKALKKSRIYKSFHFSLHGWMDYRAILIPVNETALSSNRAGKPVVRILKKVLTKL